MSEIIQFLESVLGKSRTVGNKGQIYFFSPFTNHYKRKLNININTGLWKCWITGKHGNLYSLFKELKLPRVYFDKLKTFKFGNVVYNNTVNSTEIELPENFIPLWKENNSIEKKHAIIYLKNRGIGLYEIGRYNIGYSDDYIVVPSYNKDTQLNYYVCRNYTDSSKLKYQNLSLSKNIITFEIFVHWKYDITLVEGVFDAITIGVNTIPLLGKTLPEKLKIAILENKPPRINVFLDSDAKKDAIDIAKFLVDNGINAHMIWDSNIKDPNKIGTKKSKELIEQSVPISIKDIIEFELS